MKKHRLVLLFVMTAALVVLCTAQAFAAVSFVNSPDAAYIARTSKIDFSSVTNGATVYKVSSANLTAHFATPMEKANVPDGGWMTWGAPPNTESATPAVLKMDDPNQIVVLSRPVKEFGFEMEPSPFLPESFTTTFRVSLDGATVGTLTRTADGNAGARLFAIRSDIPFDRVEIVNNDLDGFAIAQLRYVLDTRSLNYIAGNGGTIQGTASQVVGYGDAGSMVMAMPAAGYQFAGWSDGVASASRRDVNVTSNLSVQANFSKIITKASITRSPNVSSKTVTRKKGVAKYTLSAVFKGWNATPLVLTKVYLQYSTDGKKWTKAYSLTTNGSGKASKSFKIKKAQVRYYRWYVPDQADMSLAATSAKTKVRVK